MNKRTLMIATAVAALTAGSAFGQAPQGDHMNPASRNAPAEKIAPNAGAGTHSTVGTDQKSTPSNRTGQAPGSDRSTTGQAPSEPGNRMGQAPGERNNRTGERNERNNRMGEQNGPNRANKSDKSQTTGQAPTEERRNERSNRPNNAAHPNERNRSTTGQGTTEKGPMENRGATEDRTRTTPGGARANATLSTEQRSRIHSIIVGERSAPRVGHVDFSVNVGTRVPRNFHLAPIPQDIVVIEPSWRGFEYFLVGEEIVVVDPATLEIVAVLPA